MCKLILFSLALAFIASGCYAPQVIQQRYDDFKNEHVITYKGTFRTVERQDPCHLCLGWIGNETRFTFSHIKKEDHPAFTEVFTVIKDPDIHAGDLAPLAYLRIDGRDWAVDLYAIEREEKTEVEDSFGTLEESTVVYHRAFWASRPEMDQALLAAEQVTFRCYAGNDPFTVVWEGYALDKLQQFFRMKQTLPSG